MLQGGEEHELLEALAALAHRPLDFVYWAFPWGEPGTELENRKGPEPWQYQVLLDWQNALLAAEATPGGILSEAYQIAIRSGHDIGKTAGLAWIFWWAFSTREDTRGRATANTEKQLRQILQPELAKWHRLFLAKHLFKVEATTIRSADPERKDTWRFDLIPWSEDNPEAFAGLHNFGKRIIIMFDEASAINDKIWEVTDGVMHEADTELFWVCTGNPTKNTGRFRECWGRFAEQWHKYKVDSREVSFTNRAKIEKAIALWGEDSDYVKVRYLGEFPDAATTQLFPLELIRAARLRASTSTHLDPLILTLDVARFGPNSNVMGLRRGKDAKSIPIERWKGLDTVLTANRLAAAIVQHQPDVVFVDEGGIGGGVIDFVRHLGHQVVGVNFGSKATIMPGGVRCFNKRAEMYFGLLLWMQAGGAIEDSDELEDELVSIEYFHDTKTGAIKLIPKEELDLEKDQSPDWTDQLAMSFAFPVTQLRWRRPGGQIQSEYDPYSDAAFRESFDANAA